MTRAELARWLHDNPGEVYVPAVLYDRTFPVRAHKGDLIRLLLAIPEEASPWKVERYETDRKRRAWFRIILSPVGE